MFAANFHYTEQYIDEMLDMDRFFYHLEYLKINPPIGGLFLEYIRAKAGINKNDTPKNDTPKNDKETLTNLIKDFGPLKKKPKRRLRHIDLH
ncbi:hypothetical protein [Pectinatus frisingensis]|uniref:hypothetical protein n=1 Tax=Pectinatus frisingensis TaxID=865 RepID=UPI0018C7E2AF|nr:hypothetical protein [Pectinatus frisingensis]